MISETLAYKTVKPRAKGQFYFTMAIIAIVIAIAGFAPASIFSHTRTAKITLSVFFHVAIFGLWLVLFFTQTLLISKDKVRTHKRLGLVGALLAIAMVLSGYFTSVRMAQRQYDLSGDLIHDSVDPLSQLVFQLGDILSFALLVTFAIAYRRKHEIHKRLMLFATIVLLPAALAHIIGHWPFLREISAPVIVIPLFALLFAPALHDRLTRGSIHPVSLWVAVLLFVWSNVRAILVGPSETWHRFSEWLVQ